MWRLNWKRFFVVSIMVIVYALIAGLSASFPVLVRPTLIIFGANTIAAVILYIGARYYLRTRKELEVTPEEAAYLKKRYQKVTPAVVNRYHVTVWALIAVILFLSGIPLLFAQI